MDEFIRCSFKLFFTIFSSHIRGTIILYVDKVIMIFSAEPAEYTAKNLESKE